MDPITLELTAHRIGGPDGTERSWGPWLEVVSPNGVSTVSLHGRLLQSHMLRVEFNKWVPALPDFLGVRVRLSDVNGYLLGERPALVYDRPYDVPCYVGFQHPDVGIISLGIRRPQLWAPAEDPPAS